MTRPCGSRTVIPHSSDALLAELRANCTDDRVKVVKGDMRDPTVYESFGPFEIADEVASSMAAVRRCIEPGGRLVVSFRDLTLEFTGVDRAVPVRLDDDRLMVAFLEYEPAHLVIHDIVFDRGGGKWEMRKSAYKKLRLAPTKFSGLLADLGFKNVRQNTDRGFSTTMAEA